MPAERRGQAIRAMIDIAQMASGGTGGYGERRQPSLDGTSRVNRGVYARFCERLGVKFPWPTRRRSAMVVPTATGLPEPLVLLEPHLAPSREHSKSFLPQAGTRHKLRPGEKG